MPPELTSQKHHASSFIEGAWFFCVIGLVRGLTQPASELTQVQ
jgi:hypothetical protein